MQKHSNIRAQIMLESEITKHEHFGKVTISETQVQLRIAHFKKILSTNAVQKQHTRININVSKMKNNQDCIMSAVEQMKCPQAAKQASKGLWSSHAETC